jgi:hypothetical protein
MIVMPSFEDAAGLPADAGFDVPLDPHAEMVIAVHSNASALPVVLLCMFAPERWQICLPSSLP